MMKVAIIGVGHWGPNLLRNFLNHPSVDKVYCYDIDKQKMRSVCQKYSEVETVAHYDDILNNSSIGAVIVATPVSTHFELAEQALHHGKHVLVEKPLTPTPDDGITLIKHAQDRKLKLMVDHISVYNGAVRKIKEIIDSGEIGDIMYFDSVRTSQGLFQNDINVVWDLAIHDLSIVDYLLPVKPKAISATGICHFSDFEDIAYITLSFDNGCIAHLHVDWLSPLKVRKIIIGGTKKAIIFDDTEITSKIKVYDVNFDSFQKEAAVESHTPHKSGTFSPQAFDTTEPLILVTNEFIQAIEQNYEPLTNGEVGLKIVKILAAATESIKKSGATIKLTSK